MDLADVGAVIFERVEIGEAVRTPGVFW